MEPLDIEALKEKARMSTLDDYRAKLETMSELDLTKEVEDRVWLSAFAGNNPRSRYHAECDATYDECQRRQMPWLYQRGWNQAYRLAGHEPSESEIERAREPRPEGSQS